MAIDTIVKGLMEDNRIYLGDLLNRLNKNNLYIFLNTNTAYIFDEDYLKKAMIRLGINESVTFCSKEELAKRRYFCERVYKIREGKGTVYLAENMRRYLPENCRRFDVHTKGDCIVLKCS